MQHALPNVVHREGSSGFTEEIHVIPIAPGRSRVLLRQTFPDIPFLRRVLRVRTPHDRGEAGELKFPSFGAGAGLSELLALARGELELPHRAGRLPP